MDTYVVNPIAKMTSVRLKPTRSGKSALPRVRKSGPKPILCLNED